MPALLTEFQQFEEDRIKVMKDTLQKFGATNGEKPGFYTSSCDSINYAIESIAIDADIGAWVNENRTGVTVPADIQYIPYDSEVPASPKPNNRLTSNPSSLNLAGSSNSNASSSSGGGKAKPPPVGKYKAPGSADILSSREWGLSASDKNLGTEQQQSKLSGQLAELDKALAVETKTKEGLENLVRFYATDPVAQKKAEDQLSESEQKMQRISETRQMVESQLTELGGSYGDSGGGYSGSSYSAGGGSGKKVRGLYDYTATCDTELSFKEGEILSISEQDDSGWWYAELNGQTGFVPNNYVEEI